MGRGLRGIVLSFFKKINIFTYVKINDEIMRKKVKIKKTNERK